MTRDQERRADQIFDQVVEEPAAVRARLLAALCGDDAEVAAEVVAMLEADALPDLLDGEAAALDDDVLDIAAQSVLPRRFGRYVVQRYVERGGMGAVYLAERGDLGDIVAIKFLDAGAAAGEGRDVSSEQRTLASLSHPYIAKVYDAGLTADTLWFAMEYVDGPSLTEYCAAARLGIRQRLALFRAVCEAVQYAHRKFTLHLDLKPDNILVDSDGRVKLVDFGISRRLTSGEAAVPHPGSLSLNYASPEQIRGEDLDVQCDVYALGATLYELIAGRPPFERSSLPLHDMRARLDEVPPPPSIAAGQASPSQIHVSTREWRELDVLCSTAMAPDKARRYEGVDELIAELDRFLGDRPLEKWPERVRWYRAAKFFTRHRQPLAASVMTVLAISALTLFFTLRLIAARDEAVASRAQTQRIHRLMLNLFEGDDAAAGPANELRVVTLLDRGVREADGLDAEPELQAELRLTLGTLYHKLGRLDRAEPLIVAARDYYLRRQPMHPQTVNAQLSLAMLWADQFRLEDALRLARDVLASAERRRPVDPVEIARARAAIGKALAGGAEYREAVPLLELAVGELSKHEPTIALSEAMGDLANTYYYFGRIDEAEDLNQRGLELDRRLFSERHPHVGVGLFNLGNIQLDRGDYAAGQASFRQSLAINETWYGREHQKTASSVLMVGRSMAYQGRLEDAEMAYQESLRVVTATFGDMHPRVGQVWSLWGDLQMERRDLRTAEEMYEAAAAIFKRLGEHHEFYLHQQSNLAAVHIARGAYPRAEAPLRTAVQGLRAVVPEQRYTAIAQTRLAEALAGQDRHVEAEGFAVAGYHALRMRTGPKAIELIRAREVLERIYEALGQPDKARELRRP